jgi:hypothetical protein
LGRTGIWWKRKNNIVKNQRFSPAGVELGLLFRKGSIPKENVRQTAKADPFVEVTSAAWENFASECKWKAAAEIGKLSTEKRPHLYYGWENLAWALHKQGFTRVAYDMLYPILRGLKLKGPPSGRAAWCLACFSACLGKNNEAKRWLRLAATLAQDKSGFHIYTSHEPDLQTIWREIETSI